MVWSYAQSSVIRSTSTTTTAAWPRCTQWVSQKPSSRHTRHYWWCFVKRTSFKWHLWAGDHRQTANRGTVQQCTCPRVWRRARPRVTCRPTWPRLDICTCPQLGSRSRTLCITLLRWSPLQLQGQSPRSPRYLDAKYVKKKIGIDSFLLLSY